MDNPYFLHYGWVIVGIVWGWFLGLLTRPLYESFVYGYTMRRQERQKGEKRNGDHQPID